MAARVSWSGPFTLPKLNWAIIVRSLRSRHSYALAFNQRYRLKASPFAWILQVSSCTQAFNLVLLWVGASAPFELPSLTLAVIISR